MPPPWCAHQRSHLDLSELRHNHCWSYPSLAKIRSPFEDGCTRRVIYKVRPWSKCSNHCSHIPTNRQTQMGKRLPIMVIYPLVAKTRAPQHHLRELNACTRQNPGARQGACRSTACATTLMWAPEVPPGPQWAEAQPVVLPFPSQGQVNIYRWVRWGCDAQGFSSGINLHLVGLELTTTGPQAKCFNHSATCQPSHPHAISC